MHPIGLVPVIRQLSLVAAVRLCAFRHIAGRGHERPAQRHPAGLLPGALALLLPALATAAPVTLADVNIRFDSIAVYADHGTSTAALDQSALSASGLSHANASAFAGAEVGHLRAYVDGNTVSNSGGPGDNLGQSIVARPRSTARFSDGITFLSAGLNGQLVTVSASLWFEGFLSTAASACCSTPGALNGGAAQARSQITVQLLGTGLPADLGFGSSTLAAEARAWAFDPIGSPVNINREIAAVIPVEFTARIGASTPIQYLMDMQGFGFSSVFRNSAVTGISSTLFEGNYSESLSWGGIDRVVDSRGSEILNYTAFGEGGFDYRNPFPTGPVPVPEPASLYLVAAGGILLWLRRGRSNTRTRET